jgi:hypothetical protein
MLYNLGIRCTLLAFLETLRFSKFFQSRLSLFAMNCAAVWRRLASNDNKTERDGKKRLVHNQDV